MRIADLADIVHNEFERVGFKSTITMSKKVARIPNVLGQIFYVESLSPHPNSEPECLKYDRTGCQETEPVAL